MWVAPGVAWDGYGRPIVVTAPALVSPDLFTALGDKDYQVWIRYDQAQTSSTAPGFQACCANDTTVRVQDSFAIEVGQNPLVGDRQSGITIGGAAVKDARDMLRAVDATAAIVLDGAAAQQDFPADADKPRWLLPLGLVTWQSGKFVARDTNRLVKSRSYRRYIGAVAESVFAADGVLRLRDRQTLMLAGQTEDQLENDAAITSDDLTSESGTARTVGNELVWIEGNLRVTGDARVFGKKLEFLDESGRDVDVPLSVQRGFVSNDKGGQDLQVTVGKTGDGADRVTFGYLDKMQNKFTERMTVRSDGTVGIGFGGQPRTVLDVVASQVSGPPTVIANHAAIIENANPAGTTTSALALKIQTPAKADGQSNFITFFNQSGAIGSIKATGSTPSAPTSLNLVQPDSTPNDSSVLNTASAITMVTNSADFAECLPRAAATPPIGPGRIVGVFAGRVSLSTRAADSVLVTTDRPAILGNAPSADRSGEFEAVALVGQVAVVVEGAVKAGDFIVASGRGDGIGRAVAPGSLAPGDVSQVVGRAWESADGCGLRRVNAIIGTAGGATHGLAELLAAQGETIRTLCAEVARLKRKVDG
jgi:hypothetical protein